MRISSSATAQAQVQAAASAQKTTATNAAYQAKVLKRALDSQKSSADQLLKMLEPKGQVIDIRA